MFNKCQVKSNLISLATARYKCRDHSPSGCEMARQENYHQDIIGTIIWLSQRVTSGKQGGKSSLFTLSLFHSSKSQSSSHNLRNSWKDNYLNIFIIFSNLIELVMMMPSVVPAAFLTRLAWCIEQRTADNCWVFSWAIPKISWTVIPASANVFLYHSSSITKKTISQMQVSQKKKNREF